MHIIETRHKIVLPQQRTGIVQLNFFRQCAAAIGRFSSKLNMLEGSTTASAATCS